MNVVVFQTGARHNYALVRFLHEAGFLRRLYSDFTLSAGSPIEKWLKRLAPGRLKGALDRRTVRDLPHQLVVNALWGSFSHAVGSRVPNPILKAQPFGGPWKLKKADRSATDIAFTQYWTGAPCLHVLARNGAKIVSDVIITPLTHQISDAEKERFPSWGEKPFSPEDKEFFDSVSRDMIGTSAALFCPSPKVIEDICRIDPAAQSKCHLVPYASALDFREPGTPQEKRVLFAGSVLLHKGPQYLLEAAKLLWKIDRDVRFVVAGSISDTARQQMEAPNVECLGHVSKERMKAEFASADVFAFPTLAEGRAGVVLEAMAAGLPIVTTRAAGVDIVDGETGYCVPERDAEALADAILKIVSDRELRRHMSLAARKEAQSYGMEAWSARFLGALRAVHEGA